ncbi:MAG: hypothetical protein J3Q66DRAFT_438072 [Benniella sp.]|nr:MAG: hypothetical protein J3Q66DRAFT_438072 [Benniella sp.]
MTTRSGDQPLQAFRSRSTGKTANIPTHIDSKSGVRIVLWRDIKSAFKNADTIWRGTSLVPCLTDEDFEPITPLRIAYLPDMVLEVADDVLDQIHHAGQTPSSIRTGSQASESLDSRYHFRSSDGGHDISTLTRTMDALEMAVTSNHNQSLARYSTLQASESGQSIIIESLDRLQGEAEKNKELQKQLVQMQQQLQDFQQQSNEELMKRVNQMLQMQQQALDRLAIIQSRIESVIAQTYELHEYTIPRLFIVLPKSEGLSGKFKGIFSEQFRLYFLCECGAHTMSEDAKVPHQIHLAKHDGYDLDKPSAFFDRYGSYVLTLMHMIKYGVTAAGLIVPPLASSKIVEGLDTAQKHLEYLKKNIAPLVDDTIKFLNDIKSSNKMGEELAGDDSEFSQIEALEGADLRQLESYLKVKDQGRVLGNLYRIVTSEGHVKWVCFDHYRATYRETAFNQLRDVVKANGGEYIKETGTVKVKLTSSTLAKQLYDAMINARWIQELEINLEWDATMDDLRSLANAATKANVVRLTVDGAHLKGPALDVVNRTRRFDPIMQLTSNGRIQSLQLRGFEDFFARVSKSSLAPSPKLRTLSVESELPSQDKAKSLKSLTEFYPSLKTLEMRLSQEGSISDAVSTILNKLSNLESLQLDLGTVSVRVRVIKCSIQDVLLTTYRLDDLIPDDLKFAHSDNITKLAVRCGSQFWDETRLCEILRTPDFNRMSTKHEGGYYFAVAATLEWNVQDLMEIASVRSPSNLESLSIKCKRLTLTAGYSQGKIQDMALTLKQLGDLSPDDLTFARQGNLTRFAIVEILRKDDKSRLTEVLGHNPMITQLQIVCKEGHQNSTATGPSMGLQELVTSVTSDTLCKLDSLSISYGNVSVTTGISDGKVQDMRMTIEQFSKLDSDEITFIQKGHLARLVIRDIPSKIHEDQLAQIFLYNPRISHLHVGGKKQPSLATTPSLKMGLQDLVRMATSNTLNNLESLLIEYRNVSVTVGISQSKILDMVMTIEQLSILGQEGLTFIQQGRLSRLVISDTPLEADTIRVLLDSSPALTHIQIDFKKKKKPAVVSQKKRAVASQGGAELGVWGAVEAIISGCQGNLESLKIGGEELSFTASVSQGKLKDVELTVARFTDFDPQVFGFTQFDLITRMAIRQTPGEANEGQLKGILHQCVSLSHLQIGCDGGRSLAVINLVLSAREMALGQERSFSLRTFELMGENLAPFDVFEYVNGSTHIHSRLLFAEGSSSFDMHTWIRLRNGIRKKDADPVYAFVRQYGWSIVFFDGVISDGNIFEAILINIPSSRSQIETLLMHPADSLSLGDDHLANFIKRSPNFKNIGLYTDMVDVKKVKSILGRYNGTLSKFRLYGNRTERWSWFTSSFQTRDRFPALESFEVWLFEGATFQPDLIPWIMAMVSAPPRRLTSCSAAQLPARNAADGPTTHSGSESMESWTPLRAILLIGCEMQPEGWRAVIEAIDFSMLEYLCLADGDFRGGELVQLVNHISTCSVSRLPLRIIKIRAVLYLSMLDRLEAITLELRKKAPLATIVFMNDD